jgi:Tripartite tricarboxylate transporter TctB family
MPSDAEEQGAWARPVSARLGEIVMAVALLATALFFVVYSSLLSFGSLSLPGPGFFPFWLGVALGLLALAILYTAIREPSGEIVFLGHRDVLVVLVALAGAAFAFEPLDTYVTLGAFTAVLLLLVARTSLWKALLGALFCMGAVWIVFRYALGVRLPTAEFWDVVTGPIMSVFERR